MVDESFELDMLVLLPVKAALTGMVVVVPLHGTLVFGLVDRTKELLAGAVMVSNELNSPSSEVLTA
jgi:hypothetical protein